MVSEQEKILSSLQIAIQMEIDGKAYYLKTSEESSNELGKKLLQQLAGEEDSHRKVFEQIYENIRNKQGWPELDFPHDEGKQLRTLFAQAAEKLETSVTAATTELDAVQGAINMEVKSYDYYQAQLKSATYSAEKAFYSALSAQEKQHQLILLDYYEYLKDPASWFVKKEHHSLDGG